MENKELNALISGNFSTYLASVISKMPNSSQKEIVDLFVALKNGKETMTDDEIKQMMQQLLDLIIKYMTEES